MKSRKMCRMAVLLLTAACFLCFFAQGLYAASWKNFRGNAENNGVTLVALLMKADDATLYWATQIGEGWEKTPSPPIIVDDEIVFFCKNEIYTVDSVTGEVLRKGEMDASSSSSWNISPPAYGNGMLYLSLANGRIQAVDFSTLTPK